MHLARVVETSRRVGETSRRLEKIALRAAAGFPSLLWAMRGHSIKHAFDAEIFIDLRPVDPLAIAEDLGDQDGLP